MKKLVGILSILFLLTINNIYSTATPSTTEAETSNNTINTFITNLDSFINIVQQENNFDIPPDKELKKQLKQLDNEYKQLLSWEKYSLYAALVPRNGTLSPIDSTIEKNADISVGKLLTLYNSVQDLLSDTIPNIRCKLKKNKTIDNAKSSLLDEVEKTWKEFPYTVIGIAYIASKILLHNSVSKNPKLASLGFCGLAIYIYTNYTMRDVLHFSLHLGLLYSIVTLGQYTARASVF